MTVGTQCAMNGCKINQTTFLGIYGYKYGYFMIANDAIAITEKVSLKGKVASLLVLLIL